MDHKLWHHRGYLPHFDAASVCQSITYRLGDSLPRNVVAAFERRLEEESDPQHARRLRRQMDAYLDAGHGSCLLRQADVARIVMEVWQETDGVFCEIHAAVVMPNHVHILIRQLPQHPLHHLVTRWKSQSARLINRQCNRAGALWMADYWDRYIRDEEHWQRTREYIRMNPVKAGLVVSADDWPWKM